MATNNGSGKSNNKENQQSLLFQYIYQRRWSEALDRLKSSHGKEECGTTAMAELPLHHAARGAAPASVIKALVDSYPETASVPGFASMLPLHYAVVQMCDFQQQARRALVPRRDEQPMDDTFNEDNDEGEDDEETDDYGDENGTDERIGEQIPSMEEEMERAVAVVRTLVDAYPKGAASTDKWGNLPLHLGISLGGPAVLLEELLSAYPEAAMLPVGSDSLLPIHMLYGALEGGGYSDLESFWSAVKALVRVCPQVLYIPTPPSAYDSYGAYDEYTGDADDFWSAVCSSVVSLQRVEGSGGAAHEQVMEELVNVAYPNSGLPRLQAPDEGDERDSSDTSSVSLYPLHMACGATTSRGTGGWVTESLRSFLLVQTLVQMYPHELKVTVEPQNRLPLHVAVACCTSDPSAFKVVELLVRTFGGALHTPDNRGLLPLHVAVQSHAAAAESAAKEAEREAPYRYRFGYQNDAEREDNDDDDEEDDDDDEEDPIKMAELRSLSVLYFLLREGPEVMIPVLA